MYQHCDEFYAAVRILSGVGPIKKRLTSAYGDNLAHLPVEDLPKSIRARFESLRRTMVSVKPLGSESPILATVRKMSTADANRCASQIVAMFSELEQVKGSRSRTEQPSNGTQPADIATNGYRSLN